MIRYSIVCIALAYNFLVGATSTSSGGAPTPTTRTATTTARALRRGATSHEQPTRAASLALGRLEIIDRNTRCCSAPVPVPARGGETKAFVVVVAARGGENIRRRESLIRQRRLVGEYYYSDGPATRVGTMAATAAAGADDSDQLSAARVRVDRISSVLQNSVRGIESANEKHDAPRTSIVGAIRILRRVKSRAMSFRTEEADVAPRGGENCIAVPPPPPPPPSSSSSSSCSMNEDDGNTLRESLASLTCDAIAAIEALHELIHRVNRSRKHPKKSSFHSWKALESVVSPTLSYESTSTDASDSGDSEAYDELSTTLALLAVGIALSMDPADAAITKMIAGAVLPGDEKHISSRGERDANVRVFAHYMARAAVLGLLRLAVDTSGKPANVIGGCIDLQIVAKIETGFGVGKFSRMLNGEDEELSKAAADLVASVSNGPNEDDDVAYDNGHPILISKDFIAPALSIIANIRPWDYVQVERLVRMAASMDLWYSAELLCDAAIDTVLSSQPASAIQNGNKQMMATSFTHGEEAVPFTAGSLISSIPQNSIAHLAAGVIIDVTFDNRLYRRADVFASKYYSFGGHERFAEARYLHACDTIDKLIKKRQVQIIDKQIERVDDMVARVSGDARTCGYHTRWHGEGGAVETMSVRIRELSLRRLRASNNHAAAIRLAKMWEMDYEQDPIQMMEELEKRRLNFLQWDDVECPGSSSGDDKPGPLPLPEPISNPDDLLIKFSELVEMHETVGFDCEFHESINFVALLQLSTTTYSLLLDIPALAVTRDGCDALRATVGKLFTRSSDARRVIGFACKDDIKRLRASPCVTAEHWFPQNEYPYVEDLRILIAEVSPLGGGVGLQHFGL